MHCYICSAYWTCFSIDESFFCLLCKLQLYCGLRKKEDNLIKLLQPLQELDGGSMVRLAA